MRHGQSMFNCYFRCWICFLFGHSLSKNVQVRCWLCWWAGGQGVTVLGLLLCVDYVDRICAYLRWVSACFDGVLVYLLGFFLWGCQSIFFFHQIILQSLLFSLISSIVLCFRLNFLLLIWWWFLRPINCILVVFGFTQGFWWLFLYRLLCTFFRILL